MQEAKASMSMDHPKHGATTRPALLNTKYETEDEKKGLMNARALTFLGLWYIFSFCTLFLNKYILTTLGGDATLLGHKAEDLMYQIIKILIMAPKCPAALGFAGQPNYLGYINFTLYILSGSIFWVNRITKPLPYLLYLVTTVTGNTQMVMTTSLGCLQMYLPQGFNLGFKKPVDRKGKPPNFWRNMIVLGALRFSSVVLGLLALKYVAVSFTETIKSSAPIFTVAISYLLLREQTGVCTMISLIPVMAGLAMCSAYELSFNLPGFAAALATNITDCLQNVYSKLLISGEKHRYTPIELQFYTSLSSFFVQIPAGLFMINFQAVKSNGSMALLTSLILNGIFFHFQSISAYVLMGFISPVTHSVANTVKRALLIWLSVIIFSNPITFLSGLGTTTVIGGVLCYTKARQHDAASMSLQVAQKYDVEINTSNNQSDPDEPQISTVTRNSSSDSTYENCNESEKT